MKNELYSKTKKIFLSENSPRWWLGHPLVLNERLTPFFNLNDLWKISQMIKRVHCTQKFVTLVVIMTTICMYDHFDVRSFRRHKLNWNLWWMKIKMIFNCYTFPLCKIVFAILIFYPFCPLCQRANLWLGELYTILNTSLLRGGIKIIAK